MTRATGPLALLRASTREGGKTSTIGTKLVDSVFASAAGKSHVLRSSDRLRPACGCSAILFHRSSELLDNLLVDDPLYPWRSQVEPRNPCRAGPRPDLWLLFETASTWLIVFFLLQDVQRVTTYTTPPIPVRSTSNYHIMSLVDIGLSIHTT